MFQATCISGCQDLGVASEATYWSTARSGGRYGLGGVITIDVARLSTVNFWSTFGGAVLGAMAGGLIFGGQSRLGAGLGAASGATLGGLGSRFIAKQIFTFKATGTVTPASNTPGA